MKKLWYKRNAVIIASLILFFPVGVILMWRYTDWSKKSKLVVSGTVALFIAFILFGAQFLTPTIIINGATGNRINTDNAEYELTGEVSSAKDATLLINDQSVLLADDSTFSYKVSLEEGDNTYVLVATNDNGEATTEITVHRTTQAEFAARAEAEQVPDEGTSVDKPELSTSDLISMRESTKTAITRVLKAPSTAKFAGDGLFDEPLQEWEYGWADDYENVLYMSSYVDSENGFGAMIRSQFQSGFKIEGNAYNLVYVYFDGSVIYDKR